MTILKIWPGIAQAWRKQTTTEIVGQEWGERVHGVHVLVHL